MFFGIFKKNKKEISDKEVGDKAKHREFYLKELNRNLYHDFYMSLKFYSKINYLTINNLIPDKMEKEVFTLKREKYNKLFDKYHNLPDEFKKFIKRKYNVVEERPDDILDRLIYHKTLEFIFENNFK